MFNHLNALLSYKLSLQSSANNFNVIHSNIIINCLIVFPCGIGKYGIYLFTFICICQIKCLIFQIEICLIYGKGAIRRYLLALLRIKLS